MKLNAQYDIHDLLKLIEQDLQNKGLHLVGEQDINGLRGITISLTVEQFLTSPAAPEPPAALPAPAPGEVIHDESPTPPQRKPAKTEEQKAKDREYKQKWQQKKRADQAHAKDVIAQAKAKQPSQEIDPEPDPPGFLSNLDAQFQREVLGEIEALRKGQEVVAPAPLPFHFDDNEDPAEELARLAGS